MAVYKVLQDIEAEDKFLGPLTLRQFIYAAIVFVAGYLSFIGFTHGTWVVAAVMSPVILFGGFLAWPWSKDQPTEVWLLAKIRFFLKPRRRIWDQTGMKQLVTITAPKRVEQHLTNGLSQTEVQSRLKALAQTIDSRGWAVKNVTVNLSSPPAYGVVDEDSDRLIGPSALPQTVPAIDVTDDDDILDASHNPTAHHLDELISSAADTQRQQAVDKMQQASTGQPAPAPTGNWFMPAADSTASEPINDQQQALLQKINTDQPQPAAPKIPTKKAQATSTPTPDPAILKLAGNDDLNVATIARQANQTGKQPPEDEVVISLR